jgi:hypothetical protein
MLTSSNPLGVEECVQVLPRRVTMEMNLQLLGEVTSEEVHQALIQMEPMKSPGPDRFPTAFYQDHWDLVWEEVVKAVKDFFRFGWFDPDINFTHIALVPKIANPSRISDFRPISLCCEIYKILFKVMANRLKIIFPMLISHNQSTFIPGRLIADNILAAYETLHTMHTRMYGRVGYMAVKLNMSKAYDRVEWVFLERAIRRMGFDDKWVDLVMKCVTSVSFSVIVNGTPVGLFKPSRGIRQGDPLSLYLFLICVKVLSAKLTQEEVGGRLKEV